MSGAIPHRGVDRHNFIVCFTNCCCSALVFNGQSDISFCNAFCVHSLVRLLWIPVLVEVFHVARRS